MKIRHSRIFLAGISIILFFAGCKTRSADIRVGYMPNMTHAQALVGLDQKIFQKNLGDDVSIDSRVFHAGPAIIEALFAGSLDLAYVGPSPAINSYVQSDGRFVVIAGAAAGGGGVVVLNESDINTLQDLRDERILTPQLGNTQDVTTRAFYQLQGFDLKDKDGKLKILPVSNPDQINLFRRKEVKAAWTVEPWVSRLIHEGGGRLLFDESQVWRNWTGENYATTLLVVNKEFLESNPTLVNNFLKGHVEVTKYIQLQTSQAKAVSHRVLAQILGKAFPERLFHEAWNRVQFTWNPLIPSLKKNIENAKSVGFLKKEVPPIDKFVVLEPLNDVVKNYVKPT